jgi:multiple sugar transport system ATP-binding protein
MPAVVEVIEPTGADTLVFASVSGSAFCVAGRERYSFRPGATINLEPVLEYVHVFDEESGRSLTVQ